MPPGPCLVNADGLDVESLLAARDVYGTVDRSARRPADRELPGAARLSAEAEVLVPAAVSYAVDTGNQGRIGARWIVEAADMPARPAAEELLAARGVTVLPDVVVNSGTKAWWWTLFGDVRADAEEALTHTRRAMRALVGRVLDRAEADGRSARAAAHALVADGLPAIAERYGWYR